MFRHDRYSGQAATPKATRHWNWRRCRLTVGSGRLTWVPLWGLLLDRCIIASGSKCLLYLSLIGGFIRSSVGLKKGLLIVPPTVTFRTSWRAILKD